MQKHRSRRAAGDVLRVVCIRQGLAGEEAVPIGIKVTIQQDPLGIVIWHICQLPHVVGQQPILPLPGSHVDIPIQLLRADGFWIQISDHYLHHISQRFMKMQPGHLKVFSSFRRALGHGRLQCFSAGLVMMLPALKA